MLKQELIDKINQLPPAKLQEVDDFVDFIVAKDAINSTLKKAKGRGSAAGILKGKIWMSDDFDEPMEDFKDYM